VGADKKRIRRQQLNKRLRRRRLAARYRAVRDGKVEVADREAELARLKEKLARRNYPVEQLD
jgi:hypothetical protein